MPHLVFKNDGHSPENRVDLQRLRTTIGRSARSDVCIPDAFASRLHAEIRQEGDRFWLQDLGSANGTRYNGVPATMPVPLNAGDEIQIGETVLVFDDDSRSASSGSMLIAEYTEALDPSTTISLAHRKYPTSEFLDGQLASRTDLLGIISKVGVTLLSATDLDQTLDQIASLVFDAVPAERCVIMLREGKDAEEMKIMVARIRGKDGSIDQVRVSRTVMDEVLRNGKSVLTSDAQHDPRFAGNTMTLLGIRSVLSVPLSVDERNIFGMIYADSPTHEATFTEEHLNILTTLASVASIRVENASLLEERMERERMERELELATEIQQRFQPSAPPQMAGYEFQGISFPCYEIGGDYYDFIERGDGRMLLALGDVSGKGTAAALLMSSLHAAIHAQVSAGSSLERIITAVNQYLVDNTPANRFVTLFAAEIDPSTGRLAYINAGHNPPLLARTDGGISQLSSGGFPLGIMPGAEFELGETFLAPGESLLVYSDGVSEANDLDGNEFGLDRLIDVLGRSLSASASGIRDRIESALSSFTQTAPANDDITLLIAKRLSDQS